MEEENPVGVEPNTENLPVKREKARWGEGRHRKPLKRGKHGLYYTPDGKPYKPPEQFRQVADLVIKEGISRAEAFRRLGMPSSSVYNAVRRLNKSPYYNSYEQAERERYASILDRHGASKDKVAEKITQLLDAEEEKVVVLRQQTKDGFEDMVATKKVSDNKTQLAAAKLAADIHGMTPQAQAHIIKNNTTINNNGAQVSIAGNVNVVQTTAGEISAADLLPLLQQAVRNGSLAPGALATYMQEYQEAKRQNKPLPPVPLPQMALPAKADAIDADYKELP